jgi:hypothetical protein
MPYLKGNLHAHTTLSDGLLAPQELISIYRDLGYDFIAITDHDYLVPQNYWGSIPEGDGDFLVFKGIELEFPPLQYQHIGKILGDQETLFILNHPGQYRLSLRELKRQIQQVSEEMPLHCLEVTEKGVYAKMYDTPQISLLKIATDDAHLSEECGRAWIEVESKLNRDAILRAIKTGRLQMGFK